MVRINHFIPWIHIVADALRFANGDNDDFAIRADFAARYIDTGLACALNRARDITLGEFAFRPRHSTAHA